MAESDITTILNRIKLNVDAVEGGDYDSAVLDSIQSDFLSLLELIKLFLISERDSYYGYFLMNMQFCVNFRCDSIAGIKLNTFPPVFESNPLLLCKFSLKEIIYIVCHEIDHVVLNHPAEMVKANPTGDPQKYYEFNLAADAAVNDRINHEIVTEDHVFMSPPSGLITSDALKEMYNLKEILPLENYAYYLEVISESNNSEDSQSGENGQESMMSDQNQKEGEGSQSSEEDANSGASEKESDSEDSSRSESEGVSERNSDDVVTAKNYGGKLTDHNWEAGNDAEDAAAAVKELVNASVGMMNDETRGLMPGHFLSSVEKINKPPLLSWQAILKKYVGTIIANKRKTRTRLNRRQPERFDLSGTVDDKVLKIVVAIDTSGSVDDRMIGQIMNEIFAILAKRKHDITIIECDSQVQRVYKASSPADVQNKVAGRGGTWFSPAIEYINNDKYFRDALLIYFTDGYGEDEIPRPRTYRNMWVVLGDARHLSVKEPYGVVLTL